jgi:hypothetical protein
LVVVKYVLYLEKIICKKWKGIYSGHHNLFLKATNTEIKSEYFVGSKDWALLINRAPLACNVPTLGHYPSVEIYDDQSSQMDFIASTRVFVRHCGVQLALIIIFHHYEPFCTGWRWFRCIPTISMILTILSYKSMEFTEEVILGTLLGGTSQCNSSLESGGATLQDGMARSDFQWPGKPQGEIRSFSKVKRLIN